MADTRVQLEVEDRVRRNWMAAQFGTKFSRERLPKAFVPAAHQFEVFLRTLVREVSKRSVLASHPFRQSRAFRAGEGAAPEATR